MYVWLVKVNKINVLVEAWRLSEIQQKIDAEFPNNYIFEVKNIGMDVGINGDKSSKKAFIVKYSTFEYFMKDGYEQYRINNQKYIHLCNSEHEALDFFDSESEKFDRIGLPNRTIRKIIDLKTGKYII